MFPKEYRLLGVTYKEWPINNTEERDPPRRGSQGQTKKQEDNIRKALSKETQNDKVSIEKQEPIKKEEQK